MIQETNGHPQLQMIPLDHIVPWQAGQMRKNFDPVKLQELADSIEEKGVLQPVLVRPYWDDEDDGGSPPFFELVAGERRWRASKLAKQAAIPAIVRQLTDKEAVEVQVVENLQRTDLSAVEEAEGYKRLLEEHGYTADSLAGKLAKSKSYVYGRLKLCNLPDAAMTALAKGDLPATVGELIGRLPSMEMREEFWEDNFYNIGSDFFEAPSFRDVKKEIETHYMRELKGAPFGQADKKLVPEAGSCKDCPKRTGNNRGDYPDGRADLCTDVPCFERKVDAHVAREVEKAKGAGARVLGEKESKKLFNGTGDDYWLSFEAGRKYVALDGKCHDDGEGRTYGQLLEVDLTPVVAIDPRGKTHLLAPRAEAEKAIQERHGIKPKSSSNSDSYKASEKKRQKEKKLRQATAAEIVKRAVADFDYDHLSDVRFLRVMAKFLIDHGD